MKLHLGCGSQYKEGYINIDHPPSEHNVNHDIKVDVYADILTMDYNPYNGCEEIRNHHVFEHFNYYDAMVLLYKWTNVLKTGGKIIIDAPDVEELCKAYLAADVKKKFLVIRYFCGSAESRWAWHVNGWSKDTLSYVLNELGYDVIGMNQYGSYQEEQPNCGIAITAIKKENLSKEQLINKLNNILSLYKNGNADFENRLHQYFVEELKKKI